MLLKRVHGLNSEYKEKETFMVKGGCQWMENYYIGVNGVSSYTQLKGFLLKLDNAEKNKEAQQVRP